MRDLADILNPIPGDQPCGPHLRYEPVYDQLQELRREDDPSAPRGIWQTKLKVADWGGLVDLATDVLAGRSKDLQVAVWLVEGLTVRQGLIGFAAGLDLLSALSAQYWPHLWPQIGEDGDAEARLAPFDWLDDKLPQRIAMIGISDGEPMLTWHGYSSAQRRASAANQVSGRKGKGESDAAGSALEEAFAAIEGTADGFFLRLLDALELVQDRLTALRASLNEVAGRNAPSFSQISQTLTTISGFVRAVLKDRGALPDEEETLAPQPAIAPLSALDGEEWEVMGESPFVMDEEGGEPALAAAVTSGGALIIRDRDHAYRLLEQIAAYLERTEPHSPVPHLIRRAITWGQMSLPELLAEIMGEGGDVFRLLGLDRGTPPAKPKGR
jgi:type VI secretion system ImpA family protein